MVGDMDASETIDAGKGRTVEIRPTTAADAADLRELYQRFSLEDRHRRFLNAFVPTERWCESWTTVADRGGFGLIAFVHGPEGDEVIGEAGYSLQDDGDGEFAVAVASEWRGWLGIYLVDRLVRHAAASGIKNLQAEVLLENRPMLAILRHHGAVDLEHPDGVVRVSIGTGGDVPSWPPADSRHKLLVASASGRWAGEAHAADAGWATAMCRGPIRRGGGGCPVLRGERCPLAEGADAIVVMLDPGEATTEQLLAALREQLPGTPVLAVPGGHRLPDGCVDVGPTVAETFATVLSLVGMSPDVA
jgi:RimJ/RimL family protein N-acetyltransferase